MNRRRPARTLRRVAAAATCAVLAGPLSAQVATDPAAASPRRGLADAHLDGFAAAGVSVHDRGTMVAVSIRIPSGSAHDPEGREGTAWLLGRVRVDQAAEALDPARAVLTGQVERNHTVYTLLAVPDAWEAAWRAVRQVVFDAPVPPALVEAHRTALLDGLRFEAGSPARDFQQEAVSLLGDPGSPWVRPTRGTPESVEAVTAQDLEAYRRARYRPADAAVGVVGQVDDFDVSRVEPPAPPRGQAWTLGGRTALVREVTSTWMAVAYPAPAGMSRTTLELVAHLVKEELDPVPPDPDRFGVDVRLDDAPGGPVLVIEASVLPEATTRWEARITRVVRELADTRFEDDFFRWRRRRFRAARLLEEARPEAEAERITADLLRSGVPRALGVEIWALNARGLQLAVGALGEPRILLLGPDLGQLDGAGR